MEFITKEIVVITLDSDEQSGLYDEIHKIFGVENEEKYPLLSEIYNKL